MKKTIAILAVVLALWAGPLFASAFELDRVVAVVNKDVITWAELYRAMEFEFGQKMTSLDPKGRDAFFKQNESPFLDRMIEMNLQLQEAEKLGLKADDAEIKDAIDSIKKRYSMDDSAFQAALKKEGFTLEEYKKKLSDQIAIGKVISREVRDKIVITDQDVNAYIAKKGMKAQSGESYRLSHILFPAAAEDEFAAAEEKAKAALAKIRSGQSFEDVARSCSNADPDLGVLKRDMLAPEFIKALSGMKQGDVSGPFRTGEGWNLIRLDEKIAPEDRAALFLRAKKEIQEERFNRQYAAWIKQLKERSFIEIRL